MLRRRADVATASLLAFFVACGPGVSSPADGATESGGENETDGAEQDPPEYAERCGTRGPIHLVGTDETQSVFVPMPVGERLLAVVTEWNGAAYDYVDETSVRDAWVVTVDACGGDVRTVAEDIHNVFAPDGPSGPWFGRDFDEQLVWFDPSGEFPQRRVESGSFDFLRFGEDVVFNTDRLVRVRFGADGTQTEEAELAQWVEYWRPIEGPTGRERTVLATFDGGLQELDVLDGTSTRLVDNVGWFDASLDGRHVLWLHYGEPGGHRYHLLDRETGTSFQLGEECESEEYDSPSPLGKGFVSIRCAEGGVSQTHIVYLDTMEQVRLDGSYWAHVLGTDGTLMLEDSGVFGFGDLYTLERGSTEPDLRRAETVKREFWSDEEGLWFTEQDPWFNTSVLDPPEEAVTTNLWTLPYGTLQPRLVTSELFEPAVLQRNRWMGVGDFGPGRTGTLFVLQAGGGKLEVADDVVGWVRRLNSYSLSRTPAAADGVTLTVPVWYYEVQDADGDRSGLWSVELAP